MKYSYFIQIIYTQLCDRVICDPELDHLHQTQFGVIPAVGREGLPLGRCSQRILSFADQTFFFKLFLNYQTSLGKIRFISVSVFVCDKKDK